MRRARLGAIGTRQPGMADAQVPGGAPPAGEGPKGGATGSPGRPGIGATGAMPGMPPVGGGGIGVFGPAQGAQVEYRFAVKQDGIERFKTLITNLGHEGWEYVGPVPGSDELIFKRIQRPAMGGGFGGGGGQLGGGGGQLGGGGGGLGAPGKGGIGGSGGGRPGVGVPALGGLPSSGGVPALGGLPPGGGPPGGDGPGGTGKPSDQVELKMGETIRHRMNNQSVIERVFVKDSKVAEVTPDPTDAGRVLIKALATGVSQLELTDGLGNKEKYTIRVR